MDSRFSASSLFSVYTSLTAITSLVTQFYHQYIPEIVRNYVASKIEQRFNQKSSKDYSFTLVINQCDGNKWRECDNILYKACEVYTSNKLRSKATRLTGSYMDPDDPISYGIAQEEKFVEILEKDGIELLWKFVCKNNQGEQDNTGDNKNIELCFDLAYKNEVLDGHIPLVVVKYYKEMMEKKKVINLYTLEEGSWRWTSVKFNHPFTFDTLALDPEQKQAVIDDLDKFIRRKEFYKRVGRAWKRGYLLYGPPGTGKSSLIAAMANYLRFHIYDLQLGAVENDAQLRRLMLSTKNKSITVIEDIDCTMGLSRDYSTDHDKTNSHEELELEGNRDTTKANSKDNTKISLSGLLNIIDGLWSSCKDERIYVFTTNQKEKLDPALLRPGRMDMHIHMSYLTMKGFKILLNNYLGVTREHFLFEEIEQLLETAKVTPAQVAEELIRSEDVDDALSSIVEMLKTTPSQNDKKNKGFEENKKLLKDRKEDN